MVDSRSTKNNKVQQSASKIALNERIESDPLGALALPASALYGAHTARAFDNFRLSGKQLGQFANFIIAIAMIKKSSAISNHQLGSLGKETQDLIVEACEQLINGKHHDAFVVDMIQGGAGTSCNMNANEVIANLAATSLGRLCGDYSQCHPLNHVNLSQSTNDVYPTAIRVAILLGWSNFDNELKALISALQVRGQDFAHYIKLGRTQLQDAVPMTLGQEFAALANILENEQRSLLFARNSLYAVNLGGTAIGTGINAHPEFGTRTIQCLAEECGYPLFQTSDLVAASFDVGPLINVSAAFRNLALKLSKIANDLRLLNMGPSSINEINLPKVQPGSSIMPGKINPVIPEAVSQVAYQIIGFDHANSLAAESGQLQLNAMEPLIAFNLLESIELLRVAMSMLNRRCIIKLTANKKHCERLVDESAAFATALVPHIGYDNACRIVEKAQNTTLSITQLIKNEGLMDEQILVKISEQFKSYKT